MKSRSLALSLFAAGLLSAQPPAPANGHFGHGPSGPPPSFEQRLAQHLGLTATQQNTVHTAILESHVLGQGMQDKMKIAQDNLTTAIKAGNEDQIDKASADVAAIHQQQTAIHAKTMAKIYSALTTDQKTKAGPNLELLREGPGGRRGMRPPPPAGAPKPAPQQD
jgi:Spy/CpxP family protein refolding chaperone